MPSGQARLRIVSGRALITPVGESAFARTVGFCQIETGRSVPFLQHKAGGQTFIRKQRVDPARGAVRTQAVAKPVGTPKRARYTEVFRLSPATPSLQVVLPAAAMISSIASPKHGTVGPAMT